MNVFRTIVRILLGLAFVAFAIMGVAVAPPPMPGPMGAISALLYQTHWTLFVAAAQFVAGAMLVAGRFVPLALVILGAFLYNSFAVHILTSPGVLFIPAIALAMVIFVGWPYRRLFGRVFGPTPPTE